MRQRRAFVHIPPLRLTTAHSRSLMLHSSELDSKQKCRAASRCGGRKRKALVARAGKRAGRERVAAGRARHLLQRRRRRGGADLAGKHLAQAPAGGRRRRARPRRRAGGERRHWRGCGGVLGRSVAACAPHVPRRVGEERVRRDYADRRACMDRNEQQRRNQGAQQRRAGHGSPGRSACRRGALCAQGVTRLGMYSSAACQVPRNSESLSDRCHHIHCWQLALCWLGWSFYSHRCCKQAGSRLIRHGSRREHQPNHGCTGSALARYDHAPLCRAYFVELPKRAYCTSAAALSAPVSPIPLRTCSQVNGSLRCLFAATKHLKTLS